MNRSKNAVSKPIVTVKHFSELKSMRSNATTIEQYLSELPDGRRGDIEAVRQIILRNLPEEYEEAMNWGMITYQVPLSAYPDTYNGQPLMYAALSSQKNHMALHLIGIYLNNETHQDFEAKYKSTGKRYDAGKSYIRFRKLDDLPLPLVAESVALYSVKEFIKRFEKIRPPKKRKSS